MSSTAACVLAAGGSPRSARSLSRRIFLELTLVWAQIVEQINVIGIVELKPIRNPGDGRSAPLGKSGADFLAQFRIENFADADHASVRLCQLGCAPGTSGLMLSSFGY